MDNILVGQLLTETTPTPQVVTLTTSTRSPQQMIIENPKMENDADAMIKNDSW